MQFSDWQCVESLCKDIGDYLDENCSIHEDFEGHIFDLDRKGFIQIVKMIPYMMIKTIYACLCCELFDNCYFSDLNVPVLIDYFSCHHGIGLFINITELINHFSVQLHPKKKRYTSLSSNFLYLAFILSVLFNKNKGSK